jgi:hypothetical protein
MIAVNLFLDPSSIRPREVFWFVLKPNQLFPEKFQARWNNTGIIYVRTLSGRRKKVIEKGDKQEFAFTLRI